MPLDLVSSTLLLRPWPRSLPSCWENIDLGDKVFVLVVMSMNSCDLFCNMVTQLACVDVS